MDYQLQIFEREVRKKRKKNKNYWDPILIEFKEILIFSVYSKGSLH